MSIKSQTNNMRRLAVLLNFNLCNILMIERNSRSINLTKSMFFGLIALQMLLLL